MLKALFQKREYKKEKKNTHWIMIFLFFFALLFFVLPVEAEGSYNMEGYAWSSHIGWISFNCVNNDECAVSDYGVNIGVDNILTGYAWSAGGWISFNASDLTGCPSGICNARLEDDKIVGWAKQINDNETGWIKLGPNVIESTDYGAYTNGGFVLGWAWSDSFGWLSFNCENNNECGTSNYAVRYGSDVEISNINANVMYCAHDSLSTVNDGLAVHFSWDYASEYSQKSYTVEIATNDTFTSAFSKTASTSSNSYVLDLGGSSWNGEQLNWGTTYYWRVQAQNQAGTMSSWSEGSFTISRTHGSPWVKINHSPEKILIERPILFNAGESQVYDASEPEYYWTFENGDPNESTNEEETVIFNVENDFTTTLRVTDGTGYYCEKVEDFNALIFNPIWKDVSPF